MLVKARTKICPFSVTVLENEFPVAINCIFSRTPELNHAIRIDPFLSSSANLLRVAFVNNSSKCLTLEKFKAIGKIVISPRARSQVAVVSTRSNESDESLDFSMCLNPDLKTEDFEAIIAFLRKNSNMFAISLNELGSTSLVKHRIDTQGAGPIHLRPYRASRRQNEVTKTIIDDLLKNEIIRPSVSPWAAPIILVKKKVDRKECA